MELQKLTGLIVRRAAWKKLDQNVITKIVQRLFFLLGQQLTEKKLAAAVPVAGIGIGAAINWHTLSTTADGADMLYRQQFLCDKYGIPFPSGPTEASAAAADADHIPLTDIIEEEIRGASDKVGDDAMDPGSAPSSSDHD